MKKKIGIVTTQNQLNYGYNHEMKCIFVDGFIGNAGNQKHCNYAYDSPRKLSFYEIVSIAELIVCRCTAGTENHNKPIAKKNQHYSEK